MSQSQLLPTLSPADAAKTSAKFSPFNITTTTYRTVNNQPVPVHVFIPKALEGIGSKSIMVRFHGGFLITGAALYPDFTAQWALDYCIRENAILVAPDYQLLPESNGLEILSDLKYFWNWLLKDLKGYLVSIESKIQPALNRVIAYGESAGGYLAVQSALTQPDVVKAVIAAYPMLECDAPWYSEKFLGKSPFGAPEVLKSFYDKHMADIKAGEIVTEGYPPDRVPLALVIIQQGLFTKMLGEDENLYPLKVLAKTRGDETLPFLFIYHGTDDRTVPWEGTKKFADMWKEKFGEESLQSHFMPGDHGFDEDVALDTDWLQRGCASVTKAWKVKGDSL